MINVYRIETAEGEGPYCSSKMVELDIRIDDHPSPWSDGISIPSHNFICGFDSISKLMAWFDPSDRKILQSKGFVMVVYQSDDVVHGYKQVMFNRKTAKRQIVVELRNAH